MCRPPPQFHGTVVAPSPWQALLSGAQRPRDQTILGNLHRKFHPHLRQRSTILVGGCQHQHLPLYQSLSHPRHREREPLLPCVHRSLSVLSRNSDSGKDRRELLDRRDHRTPDNAVGIAEGNSRRATHEFSRRLSALVEHHRLVHRGS